jgi:acyl-CoA thioesterase-1
MMKIIVMLAAAVAALAAQTAPPRVLLIGDSISIGYTVLVRDLLAGKADVHRIAENGGPTSRGIEKIDAWLAGGKWDVIHFNFGLHDLRRMDDGKHQVALAQYETNLREIARRLKATGARVVWASTTPVPDAKLNPPRSDADVVAYNQAAARVAADMGFATDDLYALARPRLAEWQRPANVHFTPEGYAELAKQVAGSILQALSAAP